MISVPPFCGAVLWRCTLAFFMRWVQVPGVFFHTKCSEIGVKCCPALMLLCVHHGLVQAPFATWAEASSAATHARASVSHMTTSHGFFFKSLIFLQWRLTTILIDSCFLRAPGPEGAGP